MPHPRIAIRDAVHTLLVNAQVLGASIPTSHYYKEWLEDIPAASLPALNLAFDADGLGWGDGGEFTSIGDGGMKRNAVFSVSIADRFTKSNTNALNALHNFCRAVEAAILNDRGLGGLVYEVAYVETEFVYDSDATDPVAKAVITWSAKYEDRPQLDA
ncbi:MAG: hypothetical protein HQ519_00095 [Planctomycetes bacterium]|nr:hypothetical protein [Planctomycetota bacterium]